MDAATLERVKAIITIVVTAVSTIAAMYGYAVDADAWISVALSIVSAACIAWSWWKNQNITSEAIQAQAVLDHLKAERKASHAKE